MLLSAPTAQAKKFDVQPGKGTLQKAIDKARPGDKLALEPKGRYRGGVVIEKELTIRGPSDGEKLPTVDGRCGTAFTMLVFDSPVTLKNFKVTGASDAQGGQYGGAEVNFIEGGAGTATGLKLQDGCGVNYGINVFDTGDVLVTEGRYQGYDDAGVYVGGIVNPQTTVDITENVATENNRGILIEDSRGNAGIRIADNTTNSNGNGFTPSGIFLHNADEVVISGNRSDSQPVRRHPPRRQLRRQPHPRQPGERQRHLGSGWGGGRPGQRGQRQLRQRQRLRHAGTGNCERSRQACSSRGN